MRSIMTVCGEMEAGQLGFCQCHEHLAISRGVSWERNPVLLIDEEEKSLQETLQFKTCGGGTVVDAQPGGCNRMEKMLRRISEKSGVHVIASSGFHKLCFYPADHWLFTKTLAELCDIFTHELTEGMYAGIDREFRPEDTGLKAGIVKMALDKDGPTQIYQKLFRAGCHAALAANVPVMVHIEQNSDPVRLFSFLKEQGIAPDKMIFCHMDRAIPDLEIHRQLLAEGIFLEYDTIGRPKYHNDEYEIEIFRQMIGSGYEDQILFSLDTTRARLKAYTPDAVGLDYLLNVFVPAMLEKGINKEQIDKISHDNFVRAFTV